MKWELLDEDEDGNKFWIVGNQGKNKIWTFSADVFVDNKRNRSEIIFDVYSFPRHIVEDSGWKSLKDAVTDLEHSIKEMKKLQNISEKLDLDIYSDEFVGFKTTIRLDTSDKIKIEKEISRLRKALKI